MKASIIVWFLLYISSTFGELPDGHIIGGSDASIRNFPFQISFRNISNNKHKCGGAIVTEKFVLTAAHCVSTRVMKNFYIFVGSTLLSGKGQKYLIDRAIHNPNYSEHTRMYDIAIIAIKSKFIFSLEDHIQPIKIYLGNISVGTTVTVSGWGYIEHIPKLIATDHLQKAELPVISLSQCANMLDTIYPIRENQICTLAKTKGIGTCKGDSGGPVTFQGMLVGLVSWGIPCVKGHPDVHTRVASYFMWITKTINEYCQKGECSTEGRHPVYIRKKKKNSIFDNLQKGADESSNSLV